MMSRQKIRRLARAQKLMRKREGRHRDLAMRQAFELFNRQIQKMNESNERVDNLIGLLAPK